MSGVLPLAVLLGVLVVTAAAGCESTQDESARLAKQAGPLKVEQGVAITKENRDVRVLGTTVITDPNGTAVVVRLRNTSPRAQADVPVSLDVTNAAGKTVFTNATPGLARTLTHAALVPARGDALWVNDQVVAVQPTEAKAKVGAAEGSAPPASADVRVSGVKLTDDPASGPVATGVVKNSGASDQRAVQLTAVARRGQRIVAAGRGAIPRVRAGKNARFQIFFIGSPKGADLSVTAEPSPRAS